MERGAANTAWPEGGTFSTAFNAGAAGHQTDASNICEWSTDATTGFPAANTDVVANHICGGHSTGSGNVALGVLATNGSIGYADVATARNTKLTGVPAPQQDFQDYRTTSGTRDDTFWIPLQNNPDQTSGNTYVEPTKDVTNHQATGSGEVGTPGATAPPCRTSRASRPRRVLRTETRRKVTGHTPWLWAAADIRSAC